MTGLVFTEEVSRDLSKSCEQVEEELSRTRKKKFQDQENTECKGSAQKCYMF